MGIYEYLSKSAGIPLSRSLKATQSSHHPNTPGIIPGYLLGAKTPTGTPPLGATRAYSRGGGVPTEFNYRIGAGPVQHFAGRGAAANLTHRSGGLGSPYARPATQALDSRVDRLLHGGAGAAALGTVGAAPSLLRSVTQPQPQPAATPPAASKP